MPITGELYKQIGRTCAGSVCVVAAYEWVTDAVVGLTASSFVTLSFDPPMVMLALQQHADSFASMVSSKAFGVRVLTSNQSKISTLFARKARDKAGRTTFATRWILHVPLIPGALAHVECLTSQILLSGNHAIVVGLVEAAQIYSGDPLLYVDGSYRAFAALPRGVR